MNEDLIVVKQLPIIEESLKTFSEKVDKAIAEANSLVCTEETVKSVKDARAKLNNQYKSLEAQRIAAKRDVMKPYEAFEQVYKMYVSDKFKAADAQLKDKIDEVERGLREQKMFEARQYYDELASQYGIDFVSWERALPSIKITLSTSPKNIREQIERLLSHFMDDLHVISQQTYKDEIFAEYKQSLSLSNSISHVSEIHAAMEAEKQKRAEQAPVKEREEAAVARVEACAAPEVPEAVMEAPEPEQKPETAPAETAAIYTTAFRVTGTLKQLRALKQYIKDNGLEAENMEATA